MRESKLGTTEMSLRTDCTWTEIQRHLKGDGHVHELNTIRPFIHMYMSECLRIFLHTRTYIIGHTIAYNSLHIPSVKLTMVNSIFCKLYFNKVIKIQAIQL